MFRDQMLYGYKQPNIVIKAENEKFYAPKRWNKPARVFTCSWSDFFIEEADKWRDDAWNIIRETPHLTYLILTKRPENISGRLPSEWQNGWKNVWLGVSTENQETFNIRVPILLAIPTIVRFVSCEPLLGPIDICREIDWVIVGGESGPNCRAMKPEWAISLRDQCKIKKIPFFFKQWGGEKRTEAGRLLEGQKWSQIPSVYRNKV